MTIGGRDKPAVGFPRESRATSADTPERNMVNVTGLSYCMWIWVTSS